MSQKFADFTLNHPVCYRKYSKRVIVTALHPGYTPTVEMLVDPMHLLGDSI